MNIKQATTRALLALSVFGLLSAAPLSFAQSTSDSARDKTSNTTDTNEVVNPEAAQPWYANSDGAYAVSIGTGQIISLYPQARNDQTIPNGEYVEGEQSVSLKSRDYKYQLLYGLSASSVYTNSISGIGVGSDIVSTSINPYLAVFLPTRTGRYLLQYSTVVNPNDTQSGGPQAYHTVTLSGMGAIGQRWYWTAALSGSYGSESARLQGPLSFLVVQSTPVADTTSTAVLLRAKNVTFSENSFGLGWLKSRRDKITLTAFHIYTGIQSDSTTLDAASHSNAVGGRIEYVRTLTHRIDLDSYGQTESLLSGPTCNTYGGGLGIDVRMTHSVQFDVRGGPQWSTATCGSPQSANFSASLVKSFGNQDKIYAVVNRQFSTIAGLNGHWEDDAAVGFAKGIRRLTLTTDAGYLRGDALGTVVTAYHGYFVSPRVQYRLTNAFGFSGGYRSFHGAGTGLVSGNLSYAVVGIEWHPAPLHIR
jgi:hypothetical protein